MKILNIANFNNPFINKPSLKETSISNFSRTTFSNVLGADVVSFSAKKYDGKSIVNPTNHCAYCGAKVYSESQIESIAKEILSSKSDRLEGKVKSVLEKLGGAKHSQELAVAKRLENEEEIAFFEKFLDISSKKSYLRGEAIFEEVYKLPKEKALELVKEKMHPLQATIDHVSPQKEEKENNNSDINLVEACYCCNHDLKKGITFNEFYAMFPTIKNNMPGEKFRFAISQILDSSQTEILKRLSATNMLRHLERLFIQRTEASNHLDSIDFRIEGCKSGITHSIETCKNEIVVKQEELAELRKKMLVLEKDEEYKAIEKRLNLLSSLETENAALEALRGRRHKISSSINEIRNDKKGKKKGDPIPEDEKRTRIAALKENLESVIIQIADQEEKVLDIQIQIEELDKEFPTIDKLQHLKAKIDRIISAHEFLVPERNNLAQIEAKYQEVLSDLEITKDEIKSMPESTTTFNLDEHSEEEKADYVRYKDLIEALEYIEAHPNAGTLKNIIHQVAKTPIVEEIEMLSTSKAVFDYNENLRRKNLEAKVTRLEKEKLSLESRIDASKNAIEKNENIASSMTLEEAQNHQKEYIDTIRRLNEKTILVKIPQQIMSLEAEIVLLEQTIIDLHEKMNKINEDYPSGN